VETLVYHVHRSDITTALFDDIRSKIDAERVVITVEAEHIPTQSLHDLIERNRAAAYEYVVPYEDFDEMVKAFERDENFDVISAITAYKVFRKKILASIQDPVSYVFKGNEFEEYSEKLLRGESVDVEQYKQVTPSPSSTHLS
jgi:hypothetical protein